jgi:hypothetical protein
MIWLVLGAYVIGAVLMALWVIPESMWDHKPDHAFTVLAIVFWPVVAVVFVGAWLRDAWRDLR